MMLEKDGVGIVTLDSDIGERILELNHTAVPSVVENNTLPAELLCADAEGVPLREWNKLTYLPGNSNQSV